MSGNTITQSGPSTSGTSVSVTPAAATVVPAAHRPTLALSSAARQLDLRRGEFDLAVRLGRIRTVPDDGGGGRRVTRAEIDRVRSEPGFPAALRDRVTVVGTAEGAALMKVTTTRFTRLARLGLIVPVKFYLNRYRAVVWLYLAEELREFAADEQRARLLSGRIAEGLRDQLQAGLDLRPRNWRGRHMGFLLRQAEDPWARAAVLASLLDPVQVAEIVRDPYERAHLNRFRPPLASHGAPESAAAHLASRIMTASDPDEISWLRADLGQAVEEAREFRPAPRPAPKPSPPAAAHQSPPPKEPPAQGEAPERSRRLLGWLRRRNS